MTKWLTAPSAYGWLSRVTSWGFSCVGIASLCGMLLLGPRIFLTLTAATDWSAKPRRMNDLCSHDAEVKVCTVKYSSMSGVGRYGGESKKLRTSPQPVIPMHAMSVTAVSTMEIVVECPEGLNARNRRSFSVRRGRWRCPYVKDNFLLYQSLLPCFNEQRLQRRVIRVK